MRTLIVYYKQIAEIARAELYNPIQDENYPNKVRLNEKSHMDQVTTENGDLFMWLKDQSKKGILSAQVNIFAFIKI